MKIINKGRQAGKTSYLINESYKYNYPIIVSNCSKKKTVEYISEKMNKKVLRTAIVTAWAMLLFSFIFSRGTRRKITPEKITY